MSTLHSALTSLPSAHEVERAALCTLLTSPDLIMPLMMERAVHAGWFYIPAHATIYREIADMALAGQPVDLVTFCQVLTTKGLLDQCGGAGEIAALYAMAATPAHIHSYLETLRDKYFRRTMLAAVNGMVEGIMDPQKTVEETLGEVEGALFELQMQKGVGDLVPMRNIVGDVVQQIDQIRKNRGHVTEGLATGFTDFDRTTMGLKPGTFTVIAARPAMGKTALAQCAVENIGTGTGHYREYNQPAQKIVFISLEMSSEELVQRMLLSRARITLKKLRTGMFSKDEMKNLQDSVAAFMKSHILFWDTTDLSIQEIRSKMRAAKKNHGITAIILDYLQLVKSNTRSAKGNREREVTEVAEGFKHMAKELGVPVIALAQLNRESENRGTNGKPKMSDLRESGGIEQAADNVALLWRPAYYKPEAPSDFEGTDETWQQKAFLILTKHRNGPTGEIPMKWTGELTRFESETDHLMSNNEEHHQAR